jgi:hypothetical protein
MVNNLGKLHVRLHNIQFSQLGTSFSMSSFKVFLYDDIILGVKINAQF